MMRKWSSATYAKIKKCDSVLSLCDQSSSDLLSHQIQTQVIWDPSCWNPHSSTSFRVPKISSNTVIYHVMWLSKRSNGNWETEPLFTRIKHHTYLEYLWFYSSKCIPQSDCTFIVRACQHSFVVRAPYDWTAISGLILSFVQRNQ